MSRGLEEAAIFFARYVYKYVRFLNENERKNVNFLMFMYSRAFTESFTPTLNDPVTESSFIDFFFIQEWLSFFVFIFYFFVLFIIVFYSTITKNSTNR